MKIPIIFLVLWAAAPDFVRADPLPGSSLREWPANPARHEITIRRIAANDVEKKMIAAAEAACPDQAALLKTARWTRPPVGTGLWWNKEVHGIRIPFAISGAAVDYYAGLVNGYRRREFRGFSEPGSRFVYEASVMRRQEPEGHAPVFVVKMRIFFLESFAASPTEQIRFQKEREVILDQSGKVLQIAGDGDTEVPVAAL